MHSIVIVIHPQCFPMLLQEKNGELHYMNEVRYTPVFDGRMTPPTSQLSFRWEAKPFHSYTTFYRFDCSISWMLACFTPDQNLPDKIQTYKIKCLPTFKRVYLPSLRVKQPPSYSTWRWTLPCSTTIPYQTLPEWTWWHTEAKRVVLLIKEYCIKSNKCVVNFFSF